MVIRMELQSIPVLNVWLSFGLGSLALDSVCGFVAFGGDSYSEDFVVLAAVTLSQIRSRWSSDLRIIFVSKVGEEEKRIAALSIRLAANADRNKLREQRDANFDHMLAVAKSEKTSHGSSQGTKKIRDWGVLGTT